MKTSSIATKAQGKGRVTPAPVQVIPVSTFVSGSPRIVEGTCTREDYYRRNGQ